MKFLYPTFLYALTAISIPILIHLFSFRRYATVYFSNVDFLKDLRNETHRKSKIKNLLILIARILTIIALVMAFAQPYIPGRQKLPDQPNGVVSVYIDNSFSMSALSTDGQLLEVARNKAVEIAETYPPETRFLVVSNDQLAQHRHLFNKEQFIQQVSEIEVSSRSVPLSAIRVYLDNIMASLGSRNPLTSYYLSDFQTGTADIRNFRTDSLHSDYFIPLISSVISNLYIDSCWMELPAHKIKQEEILNVKVINQSNEAFQNLPLKFFLNDTLKALGNFNIEPGKEQVVQLKYMNLHGGIHLGRVEISDFPFIHDNTFYLNYEVQPKLNVLALHDGRLSDKSGLPYLKALFDNDEYISFETSGIENLQVSRLSGYNTIFLLNIDKISTGLANELKKVIANGITVVFFPEPNGNIESYNYFLSLLDANRIARIDTSLQRISGIEWNHPVYEQVFQERSETVDLPDIHGYLVFDEGTRIPETRLLWFRNNSKALSIQAFGQGNLAVFSFPLSRENERFALDELFVPTMYSLVINSLPYQKISYTIGKEKFASMPGDHVPDPSLPVVTGPGNRQEFIPRISASEGDNYKLYFQDFFSMAGHYLIKQSEVISGAISMNYDRAESDLRFLSPAELTSEIDKNLLTNTSVIEAQSRNFAQAFDEIQHGQKMWKLFLLFALLFLVAEAAIVRFR